MKIPSWHGRLTTQVQANPDDPLSQRQSFSAAFELTGSPDAGELTFFTPLGSTAAAIRWSAHSATLQAPGDTRSFAGLGPLIQTLLGTDVPVLALFAWLDGRAMQADGWDVDLAQYAQGKIIAQRRTPQPEAQLRLILEH
jgi:outer membrane lipoprotein LolB